MNTIKISLKNSKLGKIANTSTIPIKDCINSEHCRRDCYAVKAWRQYPAVREAWSHNSHMWRDEPWNAFKTTHEWLAKHKPAYFRIHVAGDFLSQEHYGCWVSLANLHPDTKFLAFTKSTSLDFSELPANLKVIASQWPGMPTWQNNLPRRAWVQDGSETRIPDNAFVCPGKCDECLECWQDSTVDIVFEEH